MKNVVDSSGWLAYFADEPSADFFVPAIEDVGGLIVPAISVYEVFKHILLRRGEDEALGRSIIGHSKAEPWDLYCRR